MPPLFVGNVNRSDGNLAGPTVTQNLYRVPPGVPQTPVLSMAFVTFSSWLGATASPNISEIHVHDTGMHGSSQVYHIGQVLALHKVPDILEESQKTFILMGRYRQR